MPIFFFLAVGMFLIQSDPFYGAPTVGWVEYSIGLIGVVFLNAAARVLGTACAQLANEIEST